MGRVTYVLAQMWGNGALKTFSLALPKGENGFPPRAYTQNAQIFAENSNVGERHGKKFSSPDLQLHTQQFGGARHHVTTELGFIW